MPKSETIKTRIEPHLKKEVERIFAELGLSTTRAISLFYYQVKLWKGLPFEIRIPNKKILKTFRDTDEGKNLVRCKDAADMFRKRGSNATIGFITFTLYVSRFTFNVHSQTPSPDKFPYLPTTSAKLSCDESCAPESQKYCGRARSNPRPCRLPASRFLPLQNSHRRR